VTVENFRSYVIRPHCSTSNMRPIAAARVAWSFCQPVTTGLTNRDVLLVVDLAGCKEPRVRAG